MPCILVIDDDPELRGVVREMLEGAGYAVLEASDGHAGVQVCQTSELDLVITVAYPRVADNISGPLPSRLRRVTQPVMSPPNRFSNPLLPLLTSI